jgi:hypothetical protein
MTCAPTAPVFWQRQPKLPLPIMKYLGARLEQALARPEDRALLVWPTVLGAPALREAHPDGIPEVELLARAEPMLAPLGAPDPAAAWARTMERLPNTAEPGPGGWLPHRIWEPLSALVSLRMGVALLAMIGQPEDDRYPVSCGVSLFNCALFHECHDALEPLWSEAQGPLRSGLQGLILLAGGFHHMQLHNPGGMMGLWEDALAALEPFAGRVATPWGAVLTADAEASAARGLEWMESYDGDRELDPIWELPRPVLELT